MPRLPCHVIKMLSQAPASFEGQLSSPGPKGIYATEPGTLWLPRAVGADQNGGAEAAVVGDPGERRIEDGDVVGGGVGAGPTRPQQSAQGFAGVVQEAQQRVVAEAPLVRGCGLVAQ